MLYLFGFLYFLSVLFVFHKIFYGKKYKKVIYGVDEYDKKLQVIYYIYLSIVSLLPVVNLISLLIIRFVYRKKQTDF